MSTYTYWQCWSRRYAVENKKNDPMIKFSFYLGTDTRDRMTEQAAIKMAYDLASRHFPNGHSIREEDGRWMSQEGPVDELTIVVSWMAEASLVVSGEADRRASQFAAAYKDGAFQEAVLVQRQTVDTFFV